MKKLLGLIVSLFMVGTLSGCSGSSIDDDAITALKDALNGEALHFSYTEYEMGAEIDGRMINTELKDVSGKFNLNGEIFVNRKEQKIQAIANMEVSEAKSILGIDRLACKFYIDGDKMYLEMLGQKQMQMLTEDDLASFEAFLKAEEGTTSGIKVSDEDMEKVKEKLTAASVEKDGKNSTITLEFDDEAFKEISDDAKIDILDAVLKINVTDNTITGMELEFTMIPQEDNGEELTIKLFFNTSNHDKKSSLILPDFSDYQLAYAGY